MLHIKVTKEFIKHYQGLPQSLKEKMKKQERFFRSDPFYPSLHTEKLEPRNRGLWSFRVDRRYRVIFIFTEHSTVIFLSIGEHEFVYRA